MPVFPMTYEPNTPTSWGLGVLRGSPIGDAQVTCRFKQVDALHPAAEGGHSGTDLTSMDARNGSPAPDGVIPVRELVAGRIRAFNTTLDSRSGYWVSVAYPDGWSSFYCHLARPVIGFNAGDAVAPGQLLGFMGNTGFSDGTHVHWTLNTPAFELADVLDFCAPPPAPMPEEMPEIVEAPVVAAPEVVDPQPIAVRTLDQGESIAAINAAAASFGLAMNDQGVTVVELSGLPPEVARYLPLGGHAYLFTTK